MAIEVGRWSGREEEARVETGMEEVARAEARAAEEETCISALLQLEGTREWLCRSPPLTSALAPVTFHIAVVSTSAAKSPTTVSPDAPKTDAILTDLAAAPPAWSLASWSCAA